jgi:predicted HD phosphohydrolase
MPINISGSQAIPPEEPDQTKKIPQWHHPASDEEMPVIDAARVVNEMTKDSSQQYVEPHLALYYLCTTAYEEWLEPFCEELESEYLDDAIKTRCWDFLGSFKTDAKTLKNFAKKKQYKELACALPDREELAQKLLGANL